VDILQKLDCNVQVICFICNDCGYVINSTLFPIVMQYIGLMGGIGSPMRHIWPYIDRFIHPVIRTDGEILNSQTDGL
jgi:hypothetical protein